MACCRWALVGQAVDAERKASVAMSLATRTWSWPLRTSSVPRDRTGRGWLRAHRGGVQPPTEREQLAQQRGGDSVGDQPSEARL
jgi:hypothetical protein